MGVSHDGGEDEGEEVGGFLRAPRGGERAELCMFPGRADEGCYCGAGNAEVCGCVDERVSCLEDLALRNALRGAEGPNGFPKPIYIAL